MRARLSLLHFLLAKSVTSLYTVPMKNLILTWLAWATVLCLFQGLAVSRIESRPVDSVFFWTPAESGGNKLINKPALALPVLGEHAAWDSEFYLSIAMNGYDDPGVRIAQGPDHASYSLNYAFMPVYPLTMRLFMQPLLWCGIDAHVGAGLCGVLVSLLGALLAMICLYLLAEPIAGAGEAMKAAWFMLIFPSGFFMAQVYTESLFIGLALLSFVLARKGRWMTVAVVASLTVLTRPSGIALVPAIALWAGMNMYRQRAAGAKQGFAYYVKVAEAVLIPLAVFLAWKLSAYGQRFDYVETHFFSRSIHPLQSLGNWLYSFAFILRGPADKAVYYAIELAALVLAGVSTLWGFRKYPDLALFGLLVLGASVSSLATQGLIRYVLACPLIFIMLARFARNGFFDRVWTLASTCLMALLAVMFSLGMWVA